MDLIIIKIAIMMCVITLLLISSDRLIKWLSIKLVKKNVVFLKLASGGIMAFHNGCLFALFFGNLEKCECFFRDDRITHYDYLKQMSTTVFADVKEHTTIDELADRLSKEYVLNNKESLDKWRYLERMLTLEFAATLIITPEELKKIKSLK